MSKGGKPPKAPDYVAAAREQGRANIEALRTGAALNRVNQRNPFGSVTYTNEGDQWTQTTELSPEQQALLYQSQRTQQDLGRIANSRLDQVGEQGAFTTQGLPDQVTGVNASQFRRDINAPSVAQNSVDLSGLAELPTDFSAERQRAEDAIYGSATRHLDPQFQQRESDLRTRLINQGLREGSEAYNREMGNLSREREAAYGDARSRAIEAGGREASRILSDALASRQQGVSERFGTGQFANQAAQQQFQNETTRTNLGNQVSGQEFAQNFANAQLQNQGRATELNERLLERQLPLQEFLQMYSGYASPLQAPSPANVGSPAPPDIMGAINQQYGAQVDAYNAQQARNSQNFGGFLGLVGGLPWDKWF